MKNLFILGALVLMVVSILALPEKPAEGQFISLPKSILFDKIRGGWAGQVIGCTFGGPTEFQFQGTFIPDYQPIPWSKDSLKWSYANIPGLYDDLYMDLTFVEVFEKEGLDAPVKSFAEAFAHAGYMLWHANQAARYNILNGLEPPASGHWLNNPHADDIDFEIEADFAGLMCPGMVDAAAKICDKIGHIMNSGDGFYGGLYVAALYSLAFLEEDIHKVVENALAIIPSESTYARVIRDVIQGHKENPSDWKETWFKIQRKWAEDIGCPDGVFSPFNIDAKINSAWVVLGLLFGDGDFGKTISISARAGDDSDCNPSNAGGILGTMIGFNQIPDFWKQGLAEVENVNFAHTATSLAKAYDLSFRHALEMVRRNGGGVEVEAVLIPVQEPVTAPLEVNFEGHYPRERRRLDLKMNEKTQKVAVDFEGVGFAVNGEAVKLEENDEDVVFEVEVKVDEAAAEKILLPTKYAIRRPTLFWRYRLAPGPHRVQLKILNPSPHAELRLADIIIYGEKPSKPEY